MDTDSLDVEPNSTSVGKRRMAAARRPVDLWIIPVCIVGLQVVGFLARTDTIYAEAASGEWGSWLNILLNVIHALAFASLLMRENWAWVFAAASTVAGGCVVLGYCISTAILPPMAGSTGYGARWYLVAGLLLVVLWRLAWKPMLAGLNARQEYIEKQISDAEGTHEKARAVLSDYEAKLADVNREGKGIIAVHVKQAEKEAKEIVTTAKQDAEAMRLKLEVDIERARVQAESELLDEAGGIVLRLGEEILGRAMNEADHERLIEQAVERLRQEKSEGVDSE